MRILISAYACGPGTGSEPEVGLQIALAAASEHEVWVVTREDNLPALESFLLDHPLSDRIHLSGHSVGGLAKRFKERGGLFAQYWYYDKWQRNLSDLAARLDEQFDFDVVHHATYASYWTRAGVAAVRKPLIWGPLGGGVTPPMRLVAILGMRGALGDLVRVLARPMVAYLTGSNRTARRASVVLAVNPETASVFGTSIDTTVLPNAIIAAFAVDSGATSLERGMNIVAASRLVGWKGIALAVRAMSHLQDPAPHLDVFGEGTQIRRLTRLAARLGVASRIRFHGHISRSQLLHEISKAGVLVHPSLHEEGGFVVAEALALGTPVVCLDRGGPPVIISYWPRVPSRSVIPMTPRTTAVAMAHAIEEVIGLRGPIDSGPADIFREEMMRAYGDAALVENPLN